MVLIVVSFLDPIVGPHLYSLGLPETYGGYCLGIMGVLHFIGSLACGYLTSFKNHQIILFAEITTTISLFAIGPSKLMGYGPSAIATFVGVGSAGFFTAFTEVLTIPTIIDAIETDF